MLDLPFGACSEIGRWDDEPDMPVIWAEHIDAATLFPTGHPEYPVAQRVPDVPGVQVVFPDHAVNRMYVSPRTEIRLKGWGMAPPQKVFIAIDMLYKGDQYYWKLLLDTPEAGLLDLMDMSADEVDDWLASFRDIMGGIDAFKVPILYGHTEPAKWIPFGRSPQDMVYNETYLKYAQLVAAAYGLRLSDIGMAELQGEKTLAGVIRGERQSKRTGRAMVRSKTKNHFNAMLPDELNFVWKDKDTEDAIERGRALLQISQGLKAAIDGGLLDQGEGRAELIASGVVETDLDPHKIPEKPEPKLPFAGAAPPFSAAKAPRGESVDEQQEQVPVDQGGRGGPTPFQARAEPEEEEPVKIDERVLMERMDEIIKPGLISIERNAGNMQLRRLIKAATRQMFEDVAVTVRSLTDEQIEQYWLPEMQAATFDQPNEIESPLIRRGIEEAKEALERHLSDDAWWSMAGVLDKDAILRLYVTAYELGLEDTALEIVRALYEEGLRPSPFLPEIDFNLTNRRTLAELERAAADLVTHVDGGTKYFLKRMITSGVRQGLSTPTIAQAIRDGDRAEAILRRDDYNENVIEIIRDGLIDMTDYRANSIVHTEIKRAENLGHWKQLSETGLKTKVWQHMGARGKTPKGNIHPCPVCDSNEKMGAVPIDFAYPTVFKSGGIDGEGGELGPPGHPGECHCRIFHDEDELLVKLATGEFAPYTGAYERERRGR
ncbi:MAG: hypothetical protein GTN64_08705 [Candidatus Latescibacteria bacterium]|nr:hypothetical protein [Candidatus Latescibacterota bacterium]NIO78679.1 hypothetical protein [Candidatus Latescibacterota bacterium]